MTAASLDGEGRRSDGVGPVVRTRRIEIVDECGLLRAVVGELPSSAAAPPAGPSTLDFGVVLLDRRGRPRAWMSLGPHGPVLGFDHEGDTAVEVGVSDAGQGALDTGGYVALNGSATVRADESEDATHRL